MVLAAMFEDDKKRKADVLEALLYPAFLVLMMLFAVGIIMFALVPAIDPVFEGIADKRPALISVLAAGRLFSCIMAGSFRSVFFWVALQSCMPGERQRDGMPFPSYGSGYPSWAASAARAGAHDTSMSWGCCSQTASR